MPKKANTAMKSAENLLSAKQAAVVAANYLKELVELQTKPLIEEVELSHDKKHWLITLSYASQNENPYVIFGGNRDFKTFEVDRESGEVLSMKIRVLK